MLHPVHKKLGFTLVELVIAMAILGLLATLGYVSWQGLTQRSYNTAVLNSLTSYKNAFTLYASQERSYPSVPRAGSYCLQDGSLTGATVNSRLTPSPGVAANISAGSPTQTSGVAHYCRNLRTTAARHVMYAPMITALNSVAKVNSLGVNPSKLATPEITGVYVTYNNNAAAVTPVLKGIFSGGSCPNGTTQDSTVTGGIICSITLDRAYPAIFTGETWSPTT